MPLISFIVACLLCVSALGPAAVLSTAAVDPQSTSNAHKRKFYNLVSDAKVAIEIGNYFAVDHLLSEALELKPSSAKTANDLAVALLQWSTEDIELQRNTRVSRVKLPTAAAVLRI